MAQWMLSIYMKDFTNLCEIAENKREVYVSKSTLDKTTKIRKAKI